MDIRRILSGLVDVIAAEAERNSAFRESIERAISAMQSDANNMSVSVAPPIGGKRRPEKAAMLDSAADHLKRPGNRRPPAVLDPVQLAREGEARLRGALVPLGLEQLRDIVADYGMDTGKLVMKWKTAERVIDRIVEVSMQRAQKGDAFRDNDDATSVAQG